MAPTPQDSINVKLLLIGNSAVGKSSLLLRFCDQQWFSEDSPMPTIGIDFRISRMEVNGQTVKICIWDTAGQERFRTITPSYYRGAQGAVLVYDVSIRESFRGISRWLEELETHAQPDIVKIIVGNKVDKEHSRVVSTDEGAGFAARNGCLFVEASAKTAEGVTEAFGDVVARIIDTPSLWHRNPTNVDGPYPGESDAENIDLSSIPNRYGSRWCRC
ncbi:P-loop containing nucleoside triphosphate hydrolase protein [Russula brevipes]|nr:P-loop containing nucleoside triphosphate hydrolase protein [Russula brevipes]